MNLVSWSKVICTIGHGYLVNNKASSTMFATAATSSLLVSVRS